MASNIWHAGLICVSPASWPDCGKVRSSWMRSGGGIGSSVKHCDITCMAGSSNHPFDSTPPETQSPIVPSRVTQRTAQPTAGFRIKRPLENQGRQRERRLQRISAHIVQHAIPFEPARAGQLGGTLRMDENHQADLFSLGPERMEFGIRKFLALDATADQGAAQSERP